MYMVIKLREFINFNLNCIYIMIFRCKVFDIIICFNYFLINFNFKLKCKIRYDYQIKYVLWLYVM